MILEEDEFISELMRRKYTIVNSNGTIRPEEKEEMEKRLGKGPDLADSPMLSFYTPRAGPRFSMDSS
jgi:hypothetical protein